MSGTPENWGFEGKVALITGAASGIGLATAHWLDRRGMGELILVDIDGQRLAEVSVGCRVQRFQGDVGDGGLWDRIAGAVPRLDHVVLNAGIPPSGQPIAELSLAEWQRVMHVNLDGVFLGLRLAMRAMSAGPGGSIVITSSVSAIRALKSTADYATAKAGVAHLARVAAAEGIAQGIRVNAISPGGVDTGIWDAQPAFEAAVAARGGDRAGVIAALGAGDTPRGAWAAPAELAANIGFLLSDLASNVTGTVMVSDGGYTL